MKKANLIVSAVMALISVVVIAVALTYPKAAAYGTGAPGPGLWPISISAVILCMSILLALKTLTGKEKSNKTKIVLCDAEHARVYISMVALLIYFFLLKPIGFLLPTFIMVTLFVYWFSKKPDSTYVAKKASSAFGKKLYEIFNIADGMRQIRPFWLCAVISLISTFAVYFIFKLGLSVPMNFGLLYI